MDVETTPPQPDPVLDAIAETLGETAAAPDPWWQAGVAENLET
ncbi:MAG TPA: hypothetical protein VI408_07730 [Gaiellaceae bacterium]